MGTCFSLSYDVSQMEDAPSAKVVSVNGELHQYNIPVSVSQVLHAESQSSSASSSSLSYFLCNSDMLTYDDYIPALNENAQLQSNHIYFVLPNSKLEYRLSASDMASLAVKGSSALQNATAQDAHRRKKARISPILQADTMGDIDYTDNYYVIKKSFVEKPKAYSQPTGNGFSRSSSVRRLHKYASSRAKLAVRSFRLKLTTIYEGSVL